jgi:hypothetical protein
MMSLMEMANYRIGGRDCSFPSLLDILISLVNKPPSEQKHAIHLMHRHGNISAELAAELIENIEKAGKRKSK